MRVVFFIGLKQSSHRHQRTSCYHSWMCEGIDCSILELSTQIRDSRPATFEDQTTHQYPSARHWTTLTWTYSTNDQKQRLKKYLCCWRFVAPFQWKAFEYPPFTGLQMQPLHFFYNLCESFGCYLLRAFSWSSPRINAIGRLPQFAKNSHCAAFWRLSSHCFAA